MPSIRARLQRRLAWLTAAVWAPASVLIVVAVALEYKAPFHGRTAHAAQLMLAFAAPQPAALPVFERQHDPDFDVDDYLVVISRNGQLLYASETLPAKELLALPMEGKLRIGDVLWLIHGFEDERTGTRVVIGVDAREPPCSSLQVAGLVALYVLIAIGS